MSNFFLAKKIAAWIVLLLICLFIMLPAYAQTNQTDLEKKISEYEQKLRELAQQKDTLFSQIQYMTTQINLTTLKIEETEQKIISTQREIEIITSRIDGLDNALDYLSRLLLNKIVAGYKNKSISVLDMILNSESANDLMSRIKYIKTAQQNNQKLLVQVQETKLNFEEQKKLREYKKIELDKLNETLNEQKQNLDLQKSAKQRLLQITQNDENTYQRLLDEAKRQLSAFKSFVPRRRAATPADNWLSGAARYWRPGPLPAAWRRPPSALLLRCPHPLPPPRRRRRPLPPQARPRSTSR